MKFSINLTTLVGEDLGESNLSKWSDSVCSKADGHVYGIPALARKVLKFNPTDKSAALIGPDLGGGYKYCGGTEDEKGCIYCTPCDWSRRGVLKIDTANGTVTVLDAPPSEVGTWTSKGALGLDGNIYYMPMRAHRILKLNTGSDTFESVGIDLGKGRYKYFGAVRGKDGCIYGIPDMSNRIVKYNPLSQLASYVGEMSNTYFYCDGNGALSRDGYIYVLTEQGRLFRINTNSTIDNDNDDNNDDNNNDNDSSPWAWVEAGAEPQIDYREGWGDPIAGSDGCVYWPPKDANRTLKYNPHTMNMNIDRDHNRNRNHNRTSLVGKDFGDGSNKWNGGALAPDGVIYCMPFSESSRILAIDPFREFTETLASNMRQYPHEFGRLFDLQVVVQQEGRDKNDEGRGIVSVTPSTCTNFDSAIAKFEQRGFEAIAKHLHMLLVVTQPHDDQDELFSTNGNNLYPFMAAASFPNVALSVVYYLLQQAPELIATE